MKIPEAKELLWINYSLTRGKGLPQGVTETNLVKAALLRPRSLFQGEELYPDAHSKTASLAEFIIKFRPFKSGNTATALASGLLMLQRNGHTIGVEDEDISLFSRQLDRGRFNFQDLVHWFRKVSK